MSAPERTFRPGTLALATVAATWLTFAPFTPEPHLVGKLRWVAGGAAGMRVMDWLDLAMHGGAAVALPVLLVVLLRRRRGV